MGDMDGIGRRRLLRRLGTTGLAAAGGVALATAAGPAAAQAADPPVEGYVGISVKDYGATGSGRDDSDDWAAIQRAMDECGPGGIVYLPKGTYRTSRPLVVPPGVTLMGTHGNHIDEGSAGWTQTNSRIKPLAGFAGEACIRVVDQATGAALDRAKTEWAAANYGQQSCEQRLVNLTLNGSALSGSTVDAIQFLGRSHGVIVRDVAVFDFPNHAIATNFLTYADGGPQAAYSCRFERIAAKGCGGVRERVQLLM
jgi:hypothetical protein